MTTIVRILSAALLIVTINAVAKSADDDAPRPIKIVTIGDSTMATQTKPDPDRPDAAGWGQVFGEYFKPQATVVNLARGGASSKSFLGLKNWQQALAEKPDYLFIQFGHNDEPGKGERETDPKTSYRDNLRRFIREVRAIGGKPVLITPVVRRIYRDGKIDPMKQPPYVEAVKIVGAEEKVPVIDLQAASIALFDRLGDEGSADLSAGPADRTHFSRKGALSVAGLVAAAIPTAVPELKPWLK